MMSTVFDLIPVLKNKQLVSDGEEKAPVTTYCSSEEQRPLLIPTISIEEDVGDGPTTPWIRRPSLASIASYSASEISST